MLRVVLGGVIGTLHRGPLRQHLALATTVTVVLSLALAHDPTAPPVPAPAATTAAGVYDDTAELRAMRRDLAAARAGRAARIEEAAPAAPAPPVVATRPRRQATPLRPARAVPAQRRPRQPAVPVVNVPAGGRAATVVAFALAQVGKPYVWAAAGPGSYDCSGLVMAAYARVGIGLPHQTGGIVGRGQRVSRAELMPGDVVFPSSGHVGIYLGGGRMVHSPKPGDRVKVSPVYAFWTARRLL